MTSNLFMRYLVLLFLAVLLVLSSCVPNRKILFFQSKDELKKKDPKDTVVRVYQLDSFNYKVQAHDLLSVRYQTLTEKEFNFMNLPTVGGTVSGGAGGGGLLVSGELVDEDGQIFMMGFGKVKVAGLTVFEIQDKLQGLAKQYLDSPIVRVRLLNYRATILGEVIKEGHLLFVSSNRVSLPEAIGQAGGFTDFADRNHVKVIRQIGSKAEVYYVDLLNEDFMTSPFYYVNTNDVIIVPPLKQRNFQKYFAKNMALILSSISLILIIISLSK
jgi:polysaccharide biosynthesis/export protein